MKSTRWRSSGTRHAFASQREHRRKTESASADSGRARSRRRPLRGRGVGLHDRPRPVLGRGSSTSASAPLVGDLGLVATGAAALCCFFLRSTGSRSRVTVPPAASIFSTADLENECAVTESFFVSSPSPRTLTSTESLRDEPGRLQRLERDVGAGLEALVERRRR